MNIAVVILNWNGAALLREFLPSVVAHSTGAVIYVADNASTDDSIAILQNEFPSVAIIRNDRNYGFAQGYNKALQGIVADVFALVNSDVAVTPNWLDPIRNAFERQPELAIAQPKIRDYKNQAKFEYAGAAGGFVDKYGYPFCRGRIFDAVEADRGQYDLPSEIFWASGACFFIRSRIFDELGGFDADFFAHQEEIDLCWRAFNRRYRAMCIPQSVVYHLGGATLQQGSPRKTFLNFRNSLLMLLKNLPVRKLFPVLVMRMLLDGIAAFQFVFKGKITHAMAVLNAHFSFYGNISKTVRKRKQPAEGKYYKVSSIVYKYFMQHRRTFTKLF